MGETVQIGDAVIEVTPLHDLDQGWTLTAVFLLGRAQLAITDGELDEASDALARLLEICTEDGITAKGIQRADPETIHRIIRVAITQGGGDDA